MALLTHGGQLAQIAKQFGIEQSQWLELSTGIAPYHYPVGHVPISAYQQLPQINNELMSAAASYYCHDSLAITNGSQAVIKLLPSLWRDKSPRSTIVYLPKHGYKEHQQAWQQAQFTICLYDDELPPLATLNQHCVLVIINPNNPTAKLFSQQDILIYQQCIASLNGLLVVDEAFMDIITPSQSMISSIDDSNVIILRSFGKFFGLAGIRIGFVLANRHWIAALTDSLGPWQVNGPAQFIAAQALSDKAWHKEQRKRLMQDRRAMVDILQSTLNKNKLHHITHTDLFITIHFSQPQLAPQLFESLCQHAVYVRLCDDKQSLRFGITTAKQRTVLARILTLIS